MNLNKIILICFFVSASNLFAQDCKAKISINTDLQSSKIYIDNNLIGEGNASVKLGIGVYPLTVMEESDRWNARSFSDTIKIVDCRDTTMNFSFNSGVYLNTEPHDAYVYHDSTLMGYTPLFIPVTPGRIILKKPGFDDKVLDFKDLKSNQKIKLNYTGEIKGKSFFEKNIFKILVGGIVALGGVTAYFKLKADDNFDKYQFSGDKYYLDQTHKYDLISGITFGTLQVGFGFLIYYFLSD